MDLNFQHLPVVVGLNNVRFCPEGLLCVLRSVSDLSIFVFAAFLFKLFSQCPLSRFSLGHDARLLWQSFCWCNGRFRTACGLSLTRMNGNRKRSRLGTLGKNCGWRCGC